MQGGWSRRMLTAGTPERWAEGKGVCLLHYLLTKEKKGSSFILFSVGWCCVRLFNRPLNKQTKGKEQEVYPINRSWRRFQKGNLLCCVTWPACLPVCLSKAGLQVLPSTLAELQPQENKTVEPIPSFYCWGLKQEARLWLCDHSPPPNLPTDLMDTANAGLDFA